jgi:predicted DCC family thiol-disulfide oxidoreductase YuxK
LVADFAWLGNAGLFGKVPQEEQQPAGRFHEMSTATEQLEDRESACKLNSTWDVEVFFDGDCPLCSREIAALRRMDRRRRIRFTDIAVDGFSPEQYDKNMSELMDQIHGRLPDGAWIVGVEVFRRLYSAVGFSWLVAATRLPLISHLLETGYRQFAKRRLKWTGRCQPSSGCRSS